MTEQKLLTRPEVLRALADGMVVEVLHGAGWAELHTYAWLNPDVFGCYEWRINPTPKRVPLTQQDIPAVCWLRRPEYSDCWFTVTFTSKSYVCVQNAEVKSYGLLQIQEWQYTSTPQDEASWRNCEKEVSE